MAHSSGGSVCHQIQQQTSAVRVYGTGSDSLEGGCIESSMGGVGGLCLSSGISPRPGGLQGGRPRLPTDDSNIPWFWDLVNLSFQDPLLLPQVENLLTQPFSKCPHRDLFNLNLHAWLLKPRAYNSKCSLKKWQQELTLLRDTQPEVSTSRSGLRLSNGASQIR